VLIYGMAGLGKLQGPSWWNGMALWGTMTAGEFVTFDFTPMARWPQLINFLTHASLALELLYPILIWIRITRPLMLLGAAAMHLGIAVMSPGLTEFTLAMLAANLAFVPGSWLRRLVADPDRPPLLLLFDGACPRCRSTLALVTAADPGSAVEPIDLTAVDVRTVHPSLTPEACLRAMHVVDGRGRVAAGFDAVGAIAGRLPLFWTFAMVAAVPGVASLGRVVYNRVSSTRPRDVPCTDQVCGIHSGTSRPVPRVLRGHVPNPHSASPSPADSHEVPRP
jgi:predicted DCC family thiol-disulfide oxidoreductase YuxK